MVTKSVYDYIKENLKDGMLPENFQLPDNCEKKGVKFACGAMDGIMMYHFGGQPETNADFIADALSEKDIPNAVKKALGEKQALFLCDPLQETLIKGKKEKKLSADNVYRGAMSLIKKSDSAECVKIGFALLELLDTEEDGEVRETLRTLGVCDEFTLWCCYILRHYKDGNEEIFRLAKSAHGWGRVFAVKEFLKPEREEIRRWLLCCGCENDGLCGYTGADVFVKADIGNILETRQPGSFEAEEVHGLAGLALDLTDEGPMAGASALDDPKGALESIKSVLVLHSEDEFVLSAIKAIDSYETEYDG